MILGYGCCEAHLGSKSTFSGRFLRLMNNPGYQLLTLEVIATLRLSRAWKRERSGRWRASAAGGG